MVQRIWDGVGTPVVKEAHLLPPFACAVCGGVGTVGTPFNDGISDSFSAHRDMAIQGGENICGACLWAMTGKPPDTFRMWSVLWRDDGDLPPSRPGAPWSAAGMHLNNKGDLSAFRSVLIDPPACAWGMAVADSGQIHTLPFARLNAPRCRRWSIRLERNHVTENPSVFRGVVHAVASLIVAGFAKADILSGQPSIHALARGGAAAWLEHSQIVTRVANSPVLELACTVVRKEEADAVRAGTQRACH